MNKIIKRDRFHILKSVHNNNLNFRKISDIFISSEWISMRRSIIDSTIIL